MDPMSIALASSLGSAALQSGGTLIGSIISGVQNKLINEQNQKNYEEAVAYQRHKDRIQMLREDTAIRRRMADFKAAGINPLVAGSVGGASTGAGGTFVPAPQLSASPVGQMIQQGLSSAGDSIQSLSGMINHTRQTESNIELQGSQVAINEQQILTPEQLKRYNEARTRLPEQQVEQAQIVLDKLNRDLWYDAVENMPPELYSQHGSQLYEIERKVRSGIELTSSEKVLRGKILEYGLSLVADKEAVTRKYRRQLEQDFTFFTYDNRNKKYWIEFFTSGLGLANSASGAVFKVLDLLK